MDFARDLNPEQFEAVTAPSGANLIIAGPGSGKTRVATYRLAHLVNRGIDPGRILLVTFTNRAAREMTSRVQALTGLDPRRLWAGTFHHIGNRILRRHAEMIERRRNFTILDQDDSEALIRASARELGHDTKSELFPRAKVIASVLGLAADDLEPIERAIAIYRNDLEEYTQEIVEIATLYEARKKANNALDFSDLQTKLLELLERSTEVRETYAGRFLDVLVDEYQDTSCVQGRVTDLLASSHGSLTVVGDDAQSIFAFRGANLENMITFPERHPGASVFMLDTNYRSTPQILGVANAAISRNAAQFPKELHATRDAGPRPEVIRCYDADEQALFIAETLEGLVEAGLPLGEVAVLYRAHFHAAELQMELGSRGISYMVTSGVRFFEQAHVKDVIAHLSIASTGGNEVSWRRAATLLRGVADATFAKIWRALSSADDRVAAASSPDLRAVVPSRAREGWDRLVGLLQGLDPASSTEFLCEEILAAGYEVHLRASFPNAEKRLEDIRRLPALADRYEDLDDFLTRVAIMGHPDEDDPVSATQTLRLSTVHRAKGQEWQVVFVLSLVEERFPSRQAMLQADIEEERRLFYVAVTRAKDRLYMMVPENDSQRGGYSRPLEQSRFISEISGTADERDAW